MIKERLAKLRAAMAERNIDIYFIPTADFHESENVGEYFKTRTFMSGFDGSAGVMAVTMNEAGLWTDGRYWIQAERQIAGSTIKLYKMGEEGVPSVEQFIDAKLPENGKLGFDGRVVNARLGMNFKKIADKHNASMHIDEDLVDLFWNDRPAMANEPAFILDTKYSGKAVAEKLHDVRAKMAEEGASVHVLTSLDDIAWLLNIRGRDIESFPVVISFAVITKEECLWFVGKNAITEAVAKHLADNNITVKPYGEIYDYLPSLVNEKVWLDLHRANYRIYNIFADTSFVAKTTPVILMKAIKNPVELENTRNAHIKDGVAFTKFMYWLKNNAGKMHITEKSAEEYLLKCREAQEGFIEPSFTTISAYGANAAMMHYHATAETNTDVELGNFYLVDSGGHYWEGSTDITRTMALGELSYEQKLHFTAVCRSTLNLAAAKFLYGCNGQNLDILARGPIWDLGIDYKCGTGHGMGYLLLIHEPPNGFRWKSVPERVDGGILEEGMVTTDEPGIYLEGKYGIRTENELICRKGEKNEHGQFMYFENITVAPIDLDGILPDEMSKTERQRLNDFHKFVYMKLSPYMTEEENAWLRHYTREI